MKISIQSMAAVASLCVAAGTVHAGDAGTLYTQLGINGWGLGYAVSAGDNVALRGQFNTAPTLSFTGDVGNFGSNSKLTADIERNSVQLLGDWYPGEGGLRLSGGVVFNNNKIKVSGNGEVNGKAASVQAEIKMSDGVSPYLGVGYAVRPKAAKGWGLVLDAGVMFQNPKSTLSATGLGITQDDVDAQNRKVQEAVDQLKLMPSLGIGVSYSF